MARSVPPSACCLETPKPRKESHSSVTPLSSGSSYPSLSQSSELLLLLLASPLSVRTASRWKWMVALRPLRTNFSNFIGEWHMSHMPSSRQILEKTQTECAFCATVHRQRQDRTPKLVEADVAVLDEIDEFVVLRHEVGHLDGDIWYQASGTC